MEQDNLDDILEKKNKRAAFNKKWREENRDKCREYCKKYYQKNKDKFLEYNKKRDKEDVICEICNITIKKGSLYLHKLTDKHLDNAKRIN